LPKFPTHNPKQIEFVEQRRKTDCGIACVAMLTYSMYNKALGLFEAIGKSIRGGLYPEDVIEVLEIYGYSVKQAEKLPKRGVALVTISWKKKDLPGHFVVWDSKRKQFLDPTFGLVNKKELLNCAKIDDIWIIK
jgi:ABC-type bacteriocin/lantibiotic exporter with double-glycine peptidase domain